MEFMEQSIGLSGAEDAQGEGAVGERSAHGIFGEVGCIFEGLIDQIVEGLRPILESLTGVKVLGSGERGPEDGTE